MNKNTKTLSSGVRVAGGTNAGSSKKKMKQAKQLTDFPTMQTITFEGLNGAECRKWWQETPDNHHVKASIRKAQVEWVVQMPVFCIREYEGFLRIMIETYDRFSQTSTFEYLGCNLIVSFKPADFTRVFGIPGHAQGGRKIESKPKKMTRETKIQLIQLVCEDLSPAEQEALLDTSRGRGLKKSNIQKGYWRCLMDIVKSRLTGSSRASDISFPHVAMMNGILNGRVYDWATLLAERMSEFMTLQHRTFYMPHYAIGLFLDTTARMIPMDVLEAKPGPLAPGEPPIMQWRHLDTLGTKTIGQKRPRTDGGNTDSGQEETSSEESGSEGEEEDDEEVEVITATPLKFPRPVLSATAHLTPVSMHGIPGFGQVRQPVVLTPAVTPVAAITQAAVETRVTPEVIADTQQLPMETAALEAMMEPADETLPEVGEELMASDTGMEAMEAPPGEEMEASGVRLEVVGSDAVVTVDTALLASPERDRESRTQKLNAFLSTRFHRNLAPRQPYIPTPARQTVPEETIIRIHETGQQEEGTPHSTVERMAEAVEKAMGVQQEHPGAQGKERQEAFYSDIASLVTRARQIVASAEMQALDSVVKELERLIAFMRLGCPAAFTVCFIERGWPGIETTEMLQDWATTTDSSTEDRAHVLIHEVVKTYREVYYTLRRSQADQAVAERAREESAARWASEKAAWESERAALLDIQKKLAAEKEQLAAEKEQLAIAKEKELEETADMMQSALELQMEAEAELKVRKEQVYKLRAELSELRARTPTTPGTHPSA